MAQAQVNQQKIVTEITPKPSPDQNELHKKLNNVEQKYLRDQDFSLYDDAYFTKTKEKNEKQDALKKV